MQKEIATYNPKLCIFITQKQTSRINITYFTTTNNKQKQKYVYLLSTSMHMNYA